MQPTTAVDEKRYDFFISYKSENVEIVRAVAELLIANHLKVWFSEYSLDSNTYLGTDEMMRDASLAGISKSKYGICFTNEAYFSSAACRMELNRFFECLEPDHVIQISVPLPAFYGQVSLSKIEIDEIRALKERLKTSPGSAFQSVPAALRQIEHLAKLKLDLSFHELGVEPASERTHFGYNDNDFSLDFSGWRVHPRWAIARANGDIPGPAFERELEGGRVSGHILVGPQDKSMTRTLTPEYNSGNKTPDRLYYHRAAEFARVVTHGLWNRAFGDLRRQAVYGTHLLFLLGHSQIAMTIFSPSNEAARFGKGGTFTRLYSIVVPELSDDPDTEVAFFFSFEGSFSAFCQRARHMDQLVLSLQRELISKQPTWRQYQNNIASWVRQPMLWITGALLLAAGLTFPNLTTTSAGGVYGFRSAFLLLIALVIGCSSSLKSLRVRGYLSSLFLMTVMLVGGFTGSTALFLFGDRLMGAFWETQNTLILLFLFGATILLLGNLIAFLMVTSSRKLQNPKTRE
jgi:hypothetical protein